jgi:hypothetical protein
VDVVHQEERQRALQLEEDAARGQQREQEEEEGAITPRRAGAWLRGTVRMLPRAASSMTRPAAIEVTPSTTNTARNERRARKPPTAGPTLMPRLIARRCRATAVRALSAGARSWMAARLAGRKNSASTDQTTTAPATAGKPRAAGSAMAASPESSSEASMTRCGGTRSHSQPAAGAAAIEPSP